MDTNETRIAVLESELKGLREQHKYHAESTNKKIDGLAEKVDGLCTVMNRGKGAFAVSMAIATLVGGTVISMIIRIIDKAVS